MVSKRICFTSSSVQYLTPAKMDPAQHSTLHNNFHANHEHTGNDVRAEEYQFDLRIVRAEFKCLVKLNKQLEHMDSLLHHDDCD